VLHPKKGEGEHSKKYNKRRKAPQIALTVLIFSTPLCMAQSALATTYLGLSGLQQSPSQQQKVSQHLVDNYQFQNRQTKFASLTPIISEADISALQTTLAQYKTKLAQLSNKDLLDPALKPQLDQAILSISTQISALEAKISKAEADLTTYNKAKQTLTKALSNYQTATDNLRDVDTRFSTATTTYQEKQALTQDAKALADASLTNLSLVKQDVQQKRDILSSADASLTTQIEITNNALTTLNNAKLLTAQATEALQTAQQELDQAQQELTTASTNKAEAQSNYDTAQAVSDLAWAEYDTAHQNTQEYVSTYNYLIDQYGVVYADYQIKQSAYYTAQQNLSTAEQNLNTAQSNYNNNLIVDPASNLPVATQGITARVYNNLNSSNPQRSDTAYNLCSTQTLTQINHNWGGGDILGCGSDRVMIHYTGYFTPTENITYLQNSADDGFYMTLDGATVINDWRLKGCGGGWYQVNLQAGRTYALDAWFYEWGGGACSTLYYQSNTNWGVVPAAWYTQSQPAPMIHDPRLKVVLDQAKVDYQVALDNYNIANSEWVQAQANQQIAAQATTNAYYTLIGLAEIENSAYAQIERSQPALDEAQINLNSLTNVYDLALSNNSQKQRLYNSAQEDLDTLQEKHNDAKTSYEEAVSQQEILEAAKAKAWNNLSNAIEQEGLAETDYNSKTSALTSAQADETLASQNLATEEANLQVAVEGESVALATKTEAEASLEEATSPLETSIDTDISFTDLETILDTPAPQPEPQPEPEPEPEPIGSPDIPKDLSADNLMDVDLTQVDPTELTEAQAEQLVEAALETFETATEGSPEYEQALDALYLAAQQDDIVVDESIANIPGVGQAAVAIANVLNLVGNIGADISPKARKKAQNLVVTTLVVGQIAQTAALASASSGGSSSSSSRTSRRK
jgi:hypothetical protein